MPIRAFISQDVPQLQATLALLEKALQGGSLEELRIAGVTTRTGKMDPGVVKTRYDQCRYELYLKAVLAVKADPAYNPALPIRCQTGLADQAQFLISNYSDPYSDPMMRAETIQRGPIFTTTTAIP